MEPGVIILRGHRDYMWLAIYEWLGTTLFLFFLNYSGGDGLLICYGLFIAVMIAGRVSGAHFNAAVTISVFIVEYKNWRRNWPICCLILLVDILGAYTGIAIACGLQQRYDTFILRPENA